MAVGDRTRDEHEQRRGSELRQTQPAEIEFAPAEIEHLLSERDHANGGRGSGEQHTGQ
jgi:hypothetical protein